MAGLLLSVLLVIPFWQVATMQGLVITNDIVTSDMANLAHPEHHILGRELKAGRPPLWAPDLYLGYPIQAEGMMGAFYPPNLLFFGLLPPLEALNVSVLLPFFVAALGTFALARRLGATLWPSLVAAVAYALGGFYVVHTKQMSIVDTACWIPVVWLTIELGLTRDRRCLLATGVVWAVQWTAGSPQITYYSLGAGSLYYLGRAVQIRRVRATAWLFGLGIALSFGLGAVQIWPTAELTTFSERAGGVSFQFASSFNYNLKNLLTWVYPYANGDPGRATYHIGGLFWEDYAYIGLLPLLAGLVGGLWLARRNRLVRWLLLIAGLTFVVALGKNTPVFCLAYEWVPGMAFFRFPQRLQAITTLCLVLTAALALTRFQRWDTAQATRAFGFVGRSWSKWVVDRQNTWIGVTMLALVIADLYVHHIRQNAIVDADTWLEPPRTAQYIRRNDGRHRIFTFGEVTQFRQAYQQAQGWQGDLQPYVAQREFLQPSLNVIYGVPSADGYVNLTPDYLTEVWGNEKRAGFVERLFVRVNGQLTARPGFNRLLSLHHVGYLITAEPFYGEGFELVGVYGPGAHLYQNKNVLPRAFVVPAYTLAADLPAALERLVAPDFDPTAEVVLLDAPADLSTTPGAAQGEFNSSVQIVHYDSLHVVIEAASAGPGFLVLSDTYYPGWEATVDAESAPIYQANGCVRAVPLSPGQNRVEFRFRPKTTYYGGLVSGLSGLVLIVAWRWVKKAG